VALPGVDRGTERRLSVRLVSNYFAGRVPRATSARASPGSSIPVRSSFCPFAHDCGTRGPSPPPANASSRRGAGGGAPK
jgi:hypothetical protein